MKGVVTRVGDRQGPVRGRVVKQYRAAGNYTIDVEVLNVAGEPDPNWPSIPQVEVGRLFTIGGGAGVFGKIAEGTIVRVAFYDFDRNQPYLDAVIGGAEAPDLDGVALLIDCGGGRVKIYETGAVSVNGGAVSVAGGCTSVGAAKDAEGGGGDVTVDAEGECQVLGEKIKVESSGDCDVEGAQVKLGKAANEPAVLGATLVNLICGIKVGNKPIDDVATLKTAMQQTALSRKVKVE